MVYKLMIDSGRRYLREPCVGASRKPAGAVPPLVKEGGDKVWNSFLSGTSRAFARNQEPT